MQRLVSVDTYLRANYDLHLILWDGYRSFTLQKILYDNQYEILKNKNSNKSDKELKEMMKLYVSSPSLDENNPFVHNTGGAVDLTLADENNNYLDMGSEFDEFSEKSETDYYERNNINEEARKNRRILYEAMTKFGFTNLPSEWWHYDFGNSFWAKYNNCNVIYKGLITEVTN